MRSQSTFARTSVIGVAFVLLLIAASVLRHQGSIAGSGRGLLLLDLPLLLAYGAFAGWIWRRRNGDSVLATAGAAGLTLGALLSVNHALELLMANAGATAQGIRGAASILLILAFFGGVGAAACERSRSIPRAIVAGLWCAAIATWITLAFALACNFAFERAVEATLSSPFAASGMSDPGAYSVRNSLEAASEFLLRMPLMAAVLSLLGACVSLFLSHSRVTALAAVWIAPFMFIGGGAALLYANTLQRSARPPFVMGGLLLAGVAVCAAYPIWSTLRRAKASPQMG